MVTDEYKSAVKKIDSIFEKYAAAKSPVSTASILPASVTKGKVYEAWVLAVLLQKLENEEGFDITREEGTELRLKAAPGPINPAYAHFKLNHPITGVSLIVWTDVEFLTLSYDTAGIPTAPIDGDYHELDIVIVRDDVVDRPWYHQVLLGVECKNSSFGKDLLRAALGVRRELSLYRIADIATHFAHWPRSFVRAYPNSCFLVYSTASSVKKYSRNGEVFGIDFHHEPIS